MVTDTLTANAHSAGAGAAADLPPAEAFLHALLGEVVAAGASDLHLTEGRPPMVRIDGEIGRASCRERVSSVV